MNEFVRVRLYDEAQLFLGTETAFLIARNMYSEAQLFFGKEAHFFIAQSICKRGSAAFCRKPKRIVIIAWEIYCQMIFCLNELHCD